MEDTQIKETLARNGFKTLELDDKCIIVTIDLCTDGWLERMEWFDRFIGREGFLKDFAQRVADDRACIAYRRVI